MASMANGPRRYSGLSGLLGVLLLALACSETAVDPTGTVIVVRAEPGVLADATSIVVTIYGSDGRSVNGGDILREQRTVELGAQFHLPYTIGITPLGGDVTRLYRVEVEARDASGGLIGTVRVISGYAPRRVLQLEVVFDDACRGITCSDAGLTCRAAVCVDAHVDPTTAPDYDADAGVGLDAGAPSCETGFGLVDGACVDVDECMVSNGGCDALTTCTNEAGGRSCGVCPNGYTGTGELGCVDYDECAMSNGGCDPNAACTNLPGASSCGACVSGFSGDNASGCVDVDECTTVAGACDALTTCTNEVGTYACTACPVGYSGTGQSGCVDVNECLVNQGGCDANATCTNTAGARACECNPGFVGDGFTCANVDECGPNPCQNGGSCADGVNAYVCTCAAGWTGGDCTQNIDDCPGADCQNGGTCVDGIASYTCTCPFGYTGANCQTIVLGCASTPCVNGSCTDTGPGTYSCACVAGYQGVNCDTPTDACAQANPCVNGGTCSPTGPGTYACQCPAGWTGTNCQTDVDECLTSNGGCSISPMVSCTNTMGARTCGACPVNYTGDGLTCTIVSCGTAPTSPNATRVVSGGLGGGSTPTVNATAAYTCSTGYSKSGANLTCQANGSWTAPTPTCTAIATFCPAPTAIANDAAASPTVSGGVAGGTTTSYGATATYTCNVGYSRSGANPTCQANGTWSATPSCVAISNYCPALTAANGSVTFTGGIVVGSRSLNSVANYTCSSGYSLSGSSTRTCQSNATWSGTAPTCVDINECATANGGCDTSPATTCTNTAGAFSCSACPAGYFGTPLTGCISGSNSCGFPTYPLPGTPGHPFSYRASASTVVDMVTGLEWTRVTPATTYTQANAISYCANLTLGGRTDWRLPSRAELVTLVNYATDPPIDVVAFPGTAADSYWTFHTNGMYGHTVDFYIGWADGYRPSASTLPVRCVR